MPIQMLPFHTTLIMEVMEMEVMAVREEAAVVALTALVATQVDGKVRMEDLENNG